VVLGWTFDSMGTGSKANIEAGAISSLYNQINPPVVQPPLPWVTTGSMGN